mmetsp:Transcript_13375/g.21865  ORF Transcript_13375/g.21865 Transcript_13375/m.21865 type:complete len:330 (+) Transcript_13375:87-1076(+)
MFQGGSRSAGDYVGAHEHAIKNTTENQDDEKNYKPVTQAFYDIVTDFYQWGWGNSFHFAPRNKGEGFHESILRQEHWLAARLDIKPNDKVCDLGCGVCGPLVNIAKFTRADITGVTIDEYQVGKGTDWIKKNGLSGRCEVVQGDFHDLPFEDESFNSGYDMEATAHSSKLATFFKEVHRCLKVNGTFGGYAWVTTEKYNPEDPEEKRIIDGIAYGNAISVVHTFEDYKNAIAQIPGLELVEEYDVDLVGDDLPWYEPLLPKYTFDGLLATPMGRFFTSNLTRVLEHTGLAPKGSYQTTQVLEEAAQCLIEGGQRGIYTPMHFYKVVKKY